MGGAGRDRGWGRGGRAWGLLSRLPGPAAWRSGARWASPSADHGPLQLPTPGQGEEASGDGGGLGSSGVGAVLYVELEAGLPVELELGPPTEGAAEAGAAEGGRCLGLSGVGGLCGVGGGGRGLEEVGRQLDAVHVLEQLEQGPHVLVELRQEASASRSVK